MWTGMWRGLRQSAALARPRLPALLPNTTAASARAFSAASAQRTIKLPHNLEGVLTEFRASKTLSKTSKGTPELMKARVQNVLLLCSDYDSYTFEEDGMLGELMHTEYSQHNLRKPPKIERVTSVGHAMEQLEKEKYDLVVSLLRTQGETLKLESFVNEVVKRDPKIPILLLALNPSELLSLDSRVDESMRVNVHKRLRYEELSQVADKTPAAAEGGVLASAWLWPFLWQGNLSLFTAMFKAVEDRLNAYDDVKQGAQVIILVEDNVKFYSQFLPTVYNELIKQSAALEDEHMSQTERMNRMQSRPKVMLCTNYEEAMDIYSRYKQETMAIITDVAFSRNGTWDATAGIDFIQDVKAERPELDVVVQSSEELMREKAEALGAAFIHKDSPSLTLELRDFFRRTLLFGPIRFYNNSNQVLAEANNITSLMRVYANLPEDVIDRVGRTNMLSKWFRARAEPALAKHFRSSIYPDDFHDFKAQGFDSERDMLRHWVITSMFSLRNRLTGAVSDAQVSDDMTPIVRVGKGSLGGKGRGFRLLHNLMDTFELRYSLPGVELRVPQSLILATDVFDRFIESNDLLAPITRTTSDAQIEQLFEVAALPADAMDALKQYAERVTSPVAVRSSSLFEDAFQQPFAGVYQSYMLHNQVPTKQERVATLASAVKRVYASVFSLEARRYAEASRLQVTDEKMAVIIQEIAGREHAPGVFGPSLAGVANAIDFYPRPNTTTDDGCASMTVGFGASVVDGHSAVNWSLGDPTVTTGKPSDFMVLHLPSEAGVSAMGSILADTTLAKYPVEKAHEMGLLKTVPGAAPVHPLVELQTRDAHGQKVVFTRRTHPATKPDPSPPALSELGIEQAVRGDALPLNQALSFFLQLGSTALACPVELEFAVNLRKQPHENHELSILQIRPMPQLISDSKSTKALRFTYLPSTQQAAVTSRAALGHGRFTGITDIVYVPPDAFSAETSEQIAAEIGQINSALRRSGKKYLLVGPGRWGTADKSRGIPVSWSQIDSSQMIVESSLPSHQAVPPSQGAHFFQNIMSFGLGYMTVDDRKGSEGEEAVDYAWLDTLDKVPSDKPLKYVKHVRVEEELEVVCDGLSRRGVIMKPGKDFDTYIAQIDAMMAITAESGSL